MTAARRIVGWTAVVTAVALSVQLAWALPLQDLRGSRAGAVVALGPNADSLYRSAREAMVQGNEATALARISTLLSISPNSIYTAPALYYRAFLLYRSYGTSGNINALREARSVLATLEARFPGTSHARDGRALEARVCGELAARGDASCRREIIRLARPAELAPNASSAVADRDEAQKCAAIRTNSVATALSSLWAADTAEAIASVKYIMPNRERCLDELRYRVILTMIDRRIPALVPFMRDVAQKDPSPRVRAWATTWFRAQLQPISQTHYPALIEQSSEVGRTGIRQPM